MHKKRAIALALCAVVLAGCNGGSGDEGATGEGPAWSHDPEDADLGPESWGSLDESYETCLTGEEQSPVDVAETVPADLPPLEFRYPETPLVVENTGHVIEVSPPENSGHTLAIGDDEYRLVQFHFHTPSEHTLDGVQYDAEVHLVHQSGSGEYAVVGVLLERSAISLPLVDLVVERAPRVAGEEVDIDQRPNLLQFLLVLEANQTVVDSYYTYPGSLTTPGCTEGVRWIILPDTLGMSAEAIDRLHRIVADFPEYDGYENNNRPVQPLNDRQIQRRD